jgi:hypothetical protein
MTILVPDLSPSRVILTPQNSPVLILELSYISLVSNEKNPVPTSPDMGVKPFGTVTLKSALINTALAG